MTQKILLTRPRASSERWAALLAARGWLCVIEPLLTIKPTHAPRPSGVFQAVLITSANALEETNLSLTDLYARPCFCVGATTGNAARRVGFTDVRCGASNGVELAQLIAATLTDKNIPLLHIAGDRTDDKAQNLLTQNGFTATKWVVYRAHAAEDFIPSTRASFAAREFTAIPVFSPRSAKILVSLIEKNNLQDACSSLTAVALSQTVANVLQDLPWQHLRVAATPAEEDVLTCLQPEFPMTQDTSPPAPPVCKRKKSCFMRGLLTVLVLASAGTAAYIYCPQFQPVTPVTQNFAPDIVALEKRVDALEERLNAQKETPPTDTTALTDSLKTLQLQIQNLSGFDQKATRQRIAEVVAFWELREAIKNGQAFTPQLEIFRATSVGDAAIVEQADKLAPYAAHPTPTLTQLRAELITQEATLASQPAPEETTSFWNHLKAIFHPLVSIHPLHDPRFAALENALDSDDAQNATEAFKALPDDAQQNLATWQTKLEARATLDTTVHTLSAVFTTPVQSGTQEKAP